MKVALVGTYELDEGAGIKDSMVANIQRARSEGAQVVLVYIHWGIEREYVPNETQMMLGHAAIDAGADLVVGSHPHVIQGYEKYQDRYIVYSLGNFCFGGNSNPDDKDCMVFQQTFTVTGDQRGAQRRHQGDSLLGFVRDRVQQLPADACRGRGGRPHPRKNPGKQRRYSPRWQSRRARKVRTGRTGKASKVPGVNRARRSAG